MRSRAAARFSSLHPDSHLQFRELLQTAHKRKLETSVEGVGGWSEMSEIMSKWFLNVPISKFYH